LFVLFSYLKKKKNSFCVKWRDFFKLPLNQNHGTFGDKREDISPNICRNYFENLKDVFPSILEQTGNSTIDKESTGEELVKKFRENLQNKRHRVVWCWMMCEHEMF